MIKSVIYSPLLSLILFVASGSFFLTFVSVKVNIIGGSDIILGLMHSAFYGGMLIGALKSEEIINRVGHIRAFASFSSLLTVTIIMQALFQSFSFWIILRFMAGFSTAAIYVVIESWLLAQSTQSNKGRILSIYMVCLYSAQTISQFGLDITDANTIEPFLLAAVMASISVIPASLTYMRAPEIKPLPKVAISKYFLASPVGFVGCIISGLVLSAIYGFFPGYAFETDKSVSVLIGITIAGGFVLQWPIGKLSDIFDRVLIITLLSFIIMVLCSILIIFLLSDIYVYIICFFLGGLCFTLYPVCIAKVCDHVNNGNIINVTGVLLFAYGTGAVIGPFVLSFMIEILSAIAVFYFIAFMAFILLLFGLYSMKNKSNIVLSQHVEFVAVPRSTPIASGLVPDAENKNR